MMIRLSCAMTSTGRQASPWRKKVLHSEATIRARCTQLALAGTLRILHCIAATCSRAVQRLAGSLHRRDTAVGLLQGMYD